MWIYEDKHWPNFGWDAQALTSQLIDIRHRQGRLVGRMEGLAVEFQQEVSLAVLTDDVVKSSAIEGENLNPQEVRSSIARHLGIAIGDSIPAGRGVEGVVTMMLDATQRFSEPLTKKRLFGWQASLFPTGLSGFQPITIGSWRTEAAGPMRVVSGPIGREKVHFKAPAAARLNQEMTAFLSWFRRKDDLDPILRAGIAHLWFVTIHPFEDGNGRIARAISDMALARADGISERCYSLSAQIEAERKDYYKQLERQQRSSPEITTWLDWFLGCLGRSLSSAETRLNRSWFKARLWNRINQSSINQRQRLIIQWMLRDDFIGHMNRSKYATKAKCSPDMALRDIQDLKAKGILIQNPSGGRSTSYRLTDKT